MSTILIRTHNMHGCGDVQEGQTFVVRLFHRIVLYHIATHIIHLYNHNFSASRYNFVFRSAIYLKIHSSKDGHFPRRQRLGLPGAPNASEYQR